MSELNDPFEADFGALDFNKFITARMGNLSGIETDEDKARVISDYRISRKRKLLVYSASQDPTVPLLWSHYAQSHSGVCVEINVDESICSSDFKLPGASVAKEVIKPITYSDEPMYISDAPVPSQDIVYKKHCDWSYEKEVRIVFQSTTEYPKTGYHLMDSKKIKYVGLILGVKFPLDKLDEITDACQNWDIKLSRSVQGHGRHKVFIS